MDEPFGALDPQIREMMQIELMKLWDQDRKTVAVRHPQRRRGGLPVRPHRHVRRPARPRRSPTSQIELPRPRWRDEEALKRSPQFVEYRHTIWHMLKQQLGAMAESMELTLNGE